MVLKNIQIHLHTYSSLEDHRWLVAQQNCPETEQMVIPVQSDFWGQIGTKRPESLLGGQFWPGSGRGFPLGTKKWVWVGQKGGCEQRAVPTPSIVTVLLRRGQLMDYGPTPIAPRKNGVTRMWGNQNPEPVRSQVSANVSLTNPGLPAGNEGLASCWQSEGRKDVSSFTTHTVILYRLWQERRQLSLCWPEHHFQMLRFREKPQERKLCYYKGSAFTKARKGTRQQSKLSPRSCDPSRPGISSPPEMAFPLGFAQSLRGKQGQIPALTGQPGEDAAIEHWTWVQAVLASHLLEAPYPLWSVPQQLTLRFLLDFGKPFSAGGSALLPCGKLAAWFAPALMASGSSGKRSGILDKRAKSMLTHSDFTSSLSFRGDRSSFLPKGTRV